MNNQHVTIATFVKGMDYGTLLDVCHISLVAEHSLSKRKVVGSIPTYGFYFVWFVCFVCLFWKERRQVRPICARHEKKWCPAPAPTICLGAFSFFVLFCLTLLITVKTAGTSCERRWCNGQHRCLPSNGSGFNSPGDAFYHRTNSGPPDWRVWRRGTLFFALEKN